MRKDWQRISVTSTRIVSQVQSKKQHFFVSSLSDPLTSPIQRDSKVNIPVTTPEEAHAFLAIMRDKSKVPHTTAKPPPSDLSGAGVDAWYMQQKMREKELRRRRKEAEALLRGYRATYDGKNIPGREGEDDWNHAAQGGRYSYGSNGVRIIIRETMEDPDSDGYHNDARVIGKLNIAETRGEESMPQLGPHVKNVQPVSRDIPEQDNDGSNIRTAMRIETTINPALKQSSVPTPAKHMVPDEREWRDFITTGACTIPDVDHRCTHFINIIYSSSFLTNIFVLR